MNRFELCSADETSQKCSDASVVDLDIAPAVPGGARIERINSIWSRNFLTLHSLGGLRLATNQAYLVGLATTGLVQLQKYRLYTKPGSLRFTNLGWVKIDIKNVRNSDSIAIMTLASPFEIQFDSVWHISYINALYPSTMLLCYGNQKGKSHKQL